MILPWTQRNDPIARLDIISLCFETQTGQIKGFSFENHWLERWVFQSLSVILWNYTERNSTKIRRQLIVHLVAIKQQYMWIAKINILCEHVCCPLNLDSFLLRWFANAATPLLLLCNHTLCYPPDISSCCDYAPKIAVSYSNAIQFATQKKTIFKSW
jgi:hypothetical protein